MFCQLEDFHPDFSDAVVNFGENRLQSFPSHGEFLDNEKNNKCMIIVQWEEK